MFVFTLNPGCHHHLFFIIQMAPDYDHLTLMEKVEVFEHAVNNTAGDDLAKLLWLKSPSSEVRLLFYSVWGWFSASLGFVRQVLTTIKQNLNPCCCFFPRCGLTGGPIILDLWLSCLWWATSWDLGTG